MLTACVLRNVAFFSGRVLATRIALPIINATRQLSVSHSCQMKIYTRTGDAGTAAMFTGERRKKDDFVFEALGTLDELSAHIGMAADIFVDTHKASASSSAVGDKEVFLARLQKVQSCLQDIGSHVATVPSAQATERYLSRVKFDAAFIDELEMWIDEYTVRVPPLRSFILPGGTQACSALHVARSVCRRAERRLVPLLEQNLDPSVYKYMNRLSDFFFTIARTIAHDNGKPERIYIKPKPTICRSKLE